MKRPVLAGAGPTRWSCCLREWVLQPMPGAEVVVISASRRLDEIAIDLSAIGRSGRRALLPWTATTTIASRKQRITR